MATFTATDPAGITHTYTGTRPVAFAIFLDRGTPGVYRAHFAKTMNSARAHWGASGKGLTRAVKAA